MHEGHGFNWLDLIPFLHGVPNHVAMAALVAVALVVLTFFARMKLVSANRSGGALIPAPKMTFLNFLRADSPSAEAIWSTRSGSV